MKIVHGNVYVHRTNIDELKASDLKLVDQAKKLTPSSLEWNMLRVSKDRSRITFSNYPDFYSDPHPALKGYASVNIDTGKIRYGKAQNNPVILHRKETFIKRTDPNYQSFKRLTEQEVVAGLYPKNLLSHIGRKNFWDEFLIEEGWEIEDHVLQRI